MENLWEEKDLCRLWSSGVAAKFKSMDTLFPLFEEIVWLIGTPLDGLTGLNTTCPTFLEYSKRPDIWISCEGGILRYE